MSAMASQITSHTIVYSAVYSGAYKKTIKAPRHWPLCGEFTGEFPAQMASNAENVFTGWRHHVRADVCPSLCTLREAQLRFSVVDSYHLNITDHMFCTVLIYGLFAGHNRASIVALVRNFWLILAERSVAPSCLRTALSANAWSLTSLLTKTSSLNPHICRKL